MVARSFPTVGDGRILSHQCGRIGKWIWQANRPAFASVELQRNYLSQCKVLNERLLCGLGYFRNGVVSMVLLTGRVMLFPSCLRGNRCFNLYLLPPDNNRDSLFRPFSSVLSPPDELVLRELVSEDVRLRLDISTAPMISSRRTSSWGDVV